MEGGGKGRIAAREGLQELCSNLLGRDYGGKQIVGVGGKGFRQIALGGMMREAWHWVLICGVFYRLLNFCL